jgi:hypothetical protein
MYKKKETTKADEKNEDEGAMHPAAAASPLPAGRPVGGV